MENAISTGKQKLHESFALFESLHNHKSMPPDNEIQYKKLLSQLPDRRRKKQLWIRQHKRRLSEVSLIESTFNKNNVSTTSLHAPQEDFFLTAHINRPTCQAIPTKCSIPSDPYEHQVYTNTFLNQSSQNKLQEQMDQIIHQKYCLSMRIHAIKKEILKIVSTNRDVWNVREVLKNSNTSEEKILKTRTAKKYQLIQHQQQDLLEIQNRIYLQQHQQCLRAERQYEDSYKKWETLKNRHQSTLKEIGNLSTKHDTMVEKIKQFKRDAQKITILMELEKLIRNIVGNTDVKSQNLDETTALIVSFYTQQKEKQQILNQLYTNNLLFLNELSESHQKLLELQKNSSEKSLSSTKQPMNSNENQTEVDKIEERRNVLHHSLMSLEQRLSYVFQRCLRIFGSIVQIWNKYDTYLMEQLNKFEKTDNLSQCIMDPQLVIYLLKKHVQQWSKYTFWYEHIIRNKLVMKYVSRQELVKSIMDVITTKKTIVKVNTKSLFFNSLKKLEELALHKVIERVNAAITSIDRIVSLCKDGRKPIINRPPNPKKELKLPEDALDNQSQRTQIRNEQQSCQTIEKPIDRKHWRQLSTSIRSRNVAKLIQRDLSQRQKQLIKAKICILSSSQTTLHPYKKNLIDEKRRVGKLRISQFQPVKYNSWLSEHDQNQI